MAEPMHQGGNLNHIVMESKLKRGGGFSLKIQRLIESLAETKKKNRKKNQTKKKKKQKTQKKTKKQTADSHFAGKGREP